MSYMTLGDLLSVLEDLRENKQSAIGDTLSFKLFGPALNGLFNRVCGVQAALVKKPLSEALKETELTHEMSAKAVYYIATGLLGLPNLAAKTRALLEEVQEKFVPSSTALALSYEDEAAAAKKRAGLLETSKATLEAFPVAPGITLYSLIAAHLEAGAKIDAMLFSRPETVAADEAARVKDAGALRSQIIDTLNRFRDALAQEISANPALPRDLVEITFSFYDQITATRQGRKTVPAKPAAKPDITAE